MEHRIEQGGDPRGYMGRDVLSLRWAVETLVDLDPDLEALLETAQRLADERLARGLSAKNSDAPAALDAPYRGGR
jgi:hypothetical protein